MLLLVVQHVVDNGYRSV